MTHTYPKRGSADLNQKLLDELGLVDNAKTTGTYFTKSMRKALAEHPHVGEVRGEGMLCAVELVEARQGRTFFEPAGQQGPKVAAALLKRGVIAERKSTRLNSSH